MANKRSRKRTAVTIAIIAGALAIAALLVWVGFKPFAGDVLQCSMPDDGRSFTPICP
ncbi:hypothetical protein [Leucobacter luti]|uniref:hypothetical protein n=1 Tax=Leucobacter luti TaxID=340320 RepID=UPI003CFECB25